MSRIRAQDRVLFTVKEFDVIQSSFPSILKSLPRSRVVSLISRARKYWDKYRQLSRKQHRATKKAAGGSPASEANVRTERKAEILAETLSRYEKGLARLEKAERPNRTRAANPPRTGTRPPTKRKKPAGKKTKPVTPAGQATLEAGVERHLQKTRTRAIQGHIRARGKRRQAKRDSR